MFHVTEAGGANFHGVVGCFRGEKPPLWEVGPPEQSRRDLRKPLVRPRLSTAPQKSRTTQTQFFSLLCLPNHTSTNQVTTSLRRSVAVSPSLLPAWGFGAAPAHPRYPRSDSLLAGYQGCFLTSVRYSKFGIQHTTIQRDVFSTNLYSITIHTVRLRYFMFLPNTNPKSHFYFRWFSFKSGSGLRTRIRPPGVKIGLVLPKSAHEKIKKWLGIIPGLFNLKYLFDLFGQSQRNLSQKTLLYDNDCAGQFSRWPKVPK